MSETAPSAETRCARAVAGARAALAALDALGVEAVVTGSLARGGFGPYSDVDILVTAIPRALKYAIESMVEDAMPDLPFGVVYRNEVPAWKLARLTAGALRASELR
jgi:predicted nucleotidyltransferase